MVPVQAPRTSDDHTESRRQRAKKPRLTNKAKVGLKTAKSLKRKPQDVANAVSEHLANIEDFAIDSEDSDDDSDSGCIIDDAEEENREIPPGVAVKWEEMVVPDVIETGKIHCIIALFE